MKVRASEKCFGCGVSKPTMWYTPVLDIGMQAVVKFKDDKDEPDDIAPLLLRECNTCKLVQLSHVVSKDRLFRKYWYKSGINDTMKEALLDIVQNAERWAKLKMDDWVIDIGSNDGTLLRFYRTCIRKVGFEPARNIWSPPDTKCIEDYFNRSDVEHLIKQYGKKPKVITAISMFYDLEDPNQFLKDVKAVLHEDGVFVVQVNSLDLMVKKFAVDNISHEHLCYYSDSVLRDLLEQNGFVVTYIEHNSINGGSVRMYCKHQGHPFPEQPELEVDWDAFRMELEDRRADIQKCIENAIGPIWGYGASTRGYSLIQWLNCEKHLNKIADRNPEKWGKYLGKISITSEEDMRMNHPRFVLVLPYSFKKEFIEREQEYLNRGGKMIFPLPEVEIV